MSTLSALGNLSNKILVNGSALSLVGLGAALFKSKNPPPGIDGFLFDIPLNDSVTYTAQVTDHFAENNLTISDHVAIEPARITLTGKVSELVYTKSAALAFLNAVIDRLSLQPKYEPQKALQAQQAISQVETFRSAVTSAVSTAKDLWSVVTTGQPAQNRQSQAFDVFEKYFYGRSIITVETPWKTFKDMIIESYTVDQSAESIYETTFTINFKEIRTVATTVNTGQLLGRISEQKADTQDSGQQVGKSAAANLLDKSFGVP